MIVFLTDGLPTAGELQTKEEIRTAIKARNRRAKIRVHALAFGDDADYPAMKEIAGDSGGLARFVCLYVCVALSWRKPKNTVITQCSSDNREWGRMKLPQEMATDDWPLPNPPTRSLQEDLRGG